MNMQEFLLYLSKLLLGISQGGVEQENAKKLGN